LRCEPIVEHDPVLHIFENGLALAEPLRSFTWDAMIAASALHADCDTLVRRYAGRDRAQQSARIVNPFRAS